MWWVELRFVFGFLVVFFFSGVCTNPPERCGSTERGTEGGAGSIALLAASPPPAPPAQPGCCHQPYKFWSQLAKKRCEWKGRKEKAAGWLGVNVAASEALPWRAQMGPRTAAWGVGLLQEAVVGLEELSTEKWGFLGSCADGWRPAARWCRAPRGLLGPGQGAVLALPSSSMPPDEEAIPEPISLSICLWFWKSDWLLSSYMAAQRQNAPQWQWDSSAVLKKQSVSQCSHFAGRCHSLRQEVGWERQAIVLKPVRGAGALYSHFSSGSFSCFSLWFIQKSTFFFLSFKICP